jgi:hypothetical protein
LLPALRLTDRFQSGSDKLAGCQLPPLIRTSTSATPLLGLPGSLAVPLTVIAELLKLCPLVGLEIVTVGAVMSVRMTVTAFVAGAVTLPTV